MSRERRPRAEDPENDWPADAYRVRGFAGVACRVLGWETEPDEDTEWTGLEPRTGRLVVLMVGDDARFTVDVEDVDALERAAYCGECGQIGCAHDGLEREDVEDVEDGLSAKRKLKGRNRMTKENCTCHVGPGKFEGESAAVYLAWDAYLQGFADDTGVVLLVDPFEPSAEQIKAAIDYGYCEPCVESAALELALCLGVACEESEQGFVSGRMYGPEDQDDWDKLMRRIESEIGGP